jgi:cation diffusion facilitator family transporter
VAKAKPEASTGGFAAVRVVLIYTMILNLMVSALKIAVGYWTGSLSILANGLDSIFDSVTNVMGLIAISLAQRPPDQEHPYGHRRYETFMTLGVAALLFITCYSIVQGAYQRLRSPTIPEVNFWSFASLLIGLALHVYTSRYEMQKGRELKSDFLIADASHTRADVLVTLTVIIGLIVVRAGFPVVDTLVALLIAVVIAKIGGDIIRSSARILIDTAVLQADQVAAVLEQIPGIESYHRIRSRGREDDIHVDLHIRVAPNMPLAQAHLIAHEAQRKLQQTLEGVRDVVIHVEPQPAGKDSQDSDLLARVRQAALEAGATIHHLNAYEIGGRYSVDLHIEVPADLTLAEAHERASALEEHVRSRITEVAEISTHIEPASAACTQCQVMDEQQALYDQVRRLIEDVPGVQDCRDVKVLSSAGQLVLSVCCTLDEGLPITQAHDISTVIEERIQRGCADVKRVFVHIEPAAVQRPPTEKG